MTTRQVVTDEQLGLYSKRERELYDRLRFGINGVDYQRTMDGLQLLIENRSATDISVIANTDEYRDYHKVKGLIFIGPKEWERAMTSRDKKNPDPLGLGQNWCPTLAVPWAANEMKELVKLCHTSEWNTTPILWLALPEVAGTPTSLVGQYGWWGVGHDNFGPGKVRQDVFWSNHYLGRDDCGWRDELPVAEPTWMIGYEHPFWTTGKDWDAQQRAVTDRKMIIATAAQDTLMLNLVLAATGKRLRLSTYSRTSTVCGGCPLAVLSSDVGVGVARGWNPEDASGSVAASVQGVPS